MKHMATSMEWNRDIESTGPKPFTRSRICSLRDEKKVEQAQQCHHPQEGGGDGGGSPTLETKYIYPIERQYSHIQQKMKERDETVKIPPQKFHISNCCIMQLYKCSRPKVIPNSVDETKIVCTISLLFLCSPCASTSSSFHYASAKKSYTGLEHVHTFPFQTVVAPSQSSQMLGSGNESGGGGAIT